MPSVFGIRMHMPIGTSWHIHPQQSTMEKKIITRMFNISNKSDFLVCDALGQDKEDEIDIIFKKPRKEGGSLVLTLPDYFCDRAKVTADSKLELIVYNSFFILRHRRGLDYNEEPMPKTLELLDKVFGIFEKEKELKRRRYFDESLDLETYDSEMREISKTLKETNLKLLSLLKEKKTSSRIPFIPSVENPEKLQSMLREIFKEHYGDT